MLNMTLPCMQMTENVQCCHLHTVSCEREWMYTALFMKWIVRYVFLLLVRFFRFYFFGVWHMRDRGRGWCKWSAEFQRKTMKRRDLEWSAAILSGKVIHKYIITIPKNIKFFHNYRFMVNPNFSLILPILEVRTDPEKPLIGSEAGVYFEWDRGRGWCEWSAKFLRKRMSRICKNGKRMWNTGITANEYVQIHHPCTHTQLTLLYFRLGRVHTQ